MKVLIWFREHCAGKGGYKDILAIGLPLMGSMLSITFMEFTDKLLLGHYSINAVAAVGPAAIAHLLFLVTFNAVISIIAILISQYIGQGKVNNIGKILWQGIWIALFFSVILFLLGLYSQEIFEYTGQPKDLIPLERQYFDTLAYLSIVPLLNSVFIAFFSGKGKTLIITASVTIAAFINIPLNYFLINGIWIFPELGIQGAAFATILAWSIELLILMFATFTKENNKIYHLFSGFCFNLPLIRRILRFGLPSGVYSFLELLGVTIFIFALGRLGTVELATINIVFSIDQFGYLPILGLSIALSIIVGRSMGEKQPLIAHRALHNTIHIALLLRFILSMVFVCFPIFLFQLFLPTKSSPETVAILAYASPMLFLCVFNGLLDTFMLMYIGLLKGVGDTFYMMLAMTLAVIFGFLFPLILLFHFQVESLYMFWLPYQIFKMVVIALFYRRYKQDAWREKSMTS